MSALVLWLNIPLCILAFGLMSGVPLWMVLRRPDRNPAETRSVPAYMTPAYMERRPEASTWTEAPAGVRIGAPRPRTARVMVPSAQH
jgi:hypothetical protein